MAQSGRAQGLSPSSPTKEYVYFNGRLIAVEERGPGGTYNIVKAPVTTGAATAKAGSSNASATTTSSTAAPFPMPALPVPNVPPQAPPSAFQVPVVVTPPDTHTVGPSSSN